ncbi:AGAP001818-PA-like protein [Anopheles sinensis]|uniref:AGAP001818-PA-like protein n=1 Tax=Anopheles sinensis TaxID=74873 RepID=A0A084VRN8_ANOSI|nr:AGAP001818-PA-like protein [Anopheles sinensis]
MFERYLAALQYPRIGQLNIDDPKDFRGFVAWLEDQKIRFYPIEERAPLRKTSALDEWNAAFEKYKKDIKLPEKEEEAKKSNAPEVHSTNPFDSYDFTNPEFEEGSWKLAERLGIAHHPDHLVALRAASRVISTAYDKEALKEPVVTGQPFPIDEGKGMGFDKDEDLERCAKILRLLQIQSVRKLQTSINETIVAAQNITADPRTDTSLGKVGLK